jgi:hypothetical protein
MPKRMCGRLFGGVSMCDGVRCLKRRRCSKSHKMVRLERARVPPIDALHGDYGPRDRIGPLSVESFDYAESAALRDLG